MLPRCILISTLVALASSALLAEEEKAINPEQAGTPLIRLEIKSIDSDSIEIPGSFFSNPSSEMEGKAVYLPFTRKQKAETDPSLKRFNIRNQEGLPTIQTYWKEKDHNGNIIPITGPTNYATLKTSYDEKTGRVSSLEYFDASGKPCIAYDERYATLGPYCRIELRYDDNQSYHVVRARCFNLSGKQTEYFYIIFREQDRYYAGRPSVPHTEKNPQGQIITEWHTDSTGKPCLSKDGYHLKTIKYNELELVCEEEFFDTEKKPTDAINGISKKVYKYTGYVPGKSGPYSLSITSFDKNGTALRISNAWCHQYAEDDKTPAQ